MVVLVPSLGPIPPRCATGADPVVVDTGVASTVQVSGDTAVVDLGAPPDTVAGLAVAEVVDVVTFATDPTGSSPGAQVRVSLTTGKVDLTTGSLTGPVSLNDIGAPVVEADSSWLPSGAPQPVDATSPVSPSLTVDLAAAFGQLGLAAPGEPLAVSVSRVVSATDGTQTVAAGMAGDRSWLAQSGSIAAVTVPAVVAEEPDAGSGPIGLIVVGVVLGVALVAASIAVASKMARRRATAATGAGPVAVGHPGSDGAAIVWQPRWEVDAGSDAGQVAGAGAGQVAGAEPGAAAPDEPVPPPLAALDDDLEELSRRLRRLDDDDR